MKYLKYALIALAPIALVIGLVMFRSGGGPDLPDAARFVDVRTGEIVKLDIGSERTKRLPGLAEDGERVMLPVEKAEGGGWVIPPHFQPIFTASFGDREGLKVDPQTFRVIE